jgi:hypothetical protein
MAFQALFAPGAGGAPAVDLRLQMPSLASEALAGAVTGAADERSFVPAESGRPAPASKGDFTYCPYFACAFDLAHGTGLLPAASHPILEPNSGALPPRLAAHSARPESALDANRARGPPVA